MEEVEIYIKLNFDQNLTESDIGKIDNISQFETQIQKQEAKDSVWRFDKINSWTISFYKTTKMNRSGYVKLPLRCSAILNFRNDDKYCFFWSILASLHPFDDSHPNRLLN